MQEETDREGERVIHIVPSIKPERPKFEEKEREQTEKQGQRRKHGRGSRRISASFLFCFLSFPCGRREGRTAGNEKRRGVREEEQSIFC